jgi:GDPmannose 4,6-dehydratase
VKIGQVVIKVDSRNYRPTEVNILIADLTKCQTKLGWKTKYTLPKLMKKMAERDLKLFEKK